jgi:hypothetical protein
VPVADENEPAPPADIALVDGGLAMPTPDRVGRALIVPVSARAEMIHEGGATLVGLRAALAAAIACGRHGERMAQGLGPAPLTDLKRLKVDRSRADSVLGVPGDRLGDHEAKRLLSAYGTAVTRQAVATTPSAAVRYAQTLGWPVEVKPHDANATSEREGGPIVGGVHNAPAVRSAFASVSTAAGLPVGSPVIVRATPPAGREVSVRIERVAELGWTAILELGSGKVFAGPAPLRRADADEMSLGLESSRAGEAAPDRTSLAELLVRASFAAVDCEGDVESIEMSRVVVGARGEGAIVCDVRIKMRKKRPERHDQLV